MKYELVELDYKMGKDIYEMYHEIPFKENEQTNLVCFLPEEAFKSYLEMELARKYQSVSYYDTPTTIYILYVDNHPVGFIGLRTKIDDNWKRWGGNFYYKVRPSERNKGYATKMLELAKKEFKKLGFKEIYGNASVGNVASEKVIENNGGILLKEENGSKHYIIKL